MTVTLWYSEKFFSFVIPILCLTPQLPGSRIPCFITLQPLTKAPSVLITVFLESLVLWSRSRIEPFLNSSCLSPLSSVSIWVGSGVLLGGLTWAFIAEGHWASHLDCGGVDFQCLLLYCISVWGSNFPNTLLFHCLINITSRQSESTTIATAVYPFLLFENRVTPTQPQSVAQWNHYWSHYWNHYPLMVTFFFFSF